MATPAGLPLYRQLLRAARGFTNYNFREHALRCVREDFRRGAALTDAEEIAAAQRRGGEQLRMLKRQSMVSQLFPQEKHAMESLKGR